MKRAKISWKGEKQLIILDNITNIHYIEKDKVVNIAFIGGAVIDITYDKSLKLDTVDIADLEQLVSRLDRMMN